MVVPYNWQEFVPALADYGCPYVYKTNLNFQLTHCTHFTSLIHVVSSRCRCSLSRTKALFVYFLLLIICIVFTFKFWIMAGKFALNSKVQTVDELGRWCDGRILEIGDDDLFVCFPGYPDSSLRVAVDSDKVRERVLPYEQQLRGKP